MKRGGSRTIDRFVSVDGSVEELLEFDFETPSQRLELYSVTSFYVGKILNYFRNIFCI